MAGENPDNPNITNAAFKLQDCLEVQLDNTHPDFLDNTLHRDQVLARFQPVFDPSHLARLKKTELESFLIHQWGSKT